MIGKLYIVATPIGNLEDITLRALRVLKEVDLIAAEDTRQTLKLLNHYEINKPLISYHRHNEETKSEILIEKLRNGENIALVSDAGTPGICDPGEEVIKKAIEDNIEVIPIPGACAMINALIVSGISTKEFEFLGFLPLNKKLRRQKLKEIENSSKTIIIYEAPHKMKTTLGDLKEILKDRKIVLARELTKIHEEFIRKSIDELLKNNKVPKNIRKEKIIELLKLVGLDKQYIDKYPRELSGGQCQRAAIAKAISCEPKILICDEVTSALDVSIQGQVISLLKELKEKKNMTYIFICHDLALVELLCDKVIVLNKGNIVESGDAKEIINNPIHPYTKLLVNSIFPVKNKNWNIPDILIDEQKENNSFCKFYNRCNNKSKDCLNSDIKLQTLNKNHFVKCNNI